MRSPPPSPGLPAWSRPDLPATSHPVPLTNVLREDVPAPTLDVDELLAGAPASEDSMFLVPQILGEDSAS